MAGPVGRHPVHWNGRPVVVLGPSIFCDEYRGKWMGHERRHPAPPGYPQAGTAVFRLPPVAAEDVPVHIGRLLRQAREARELSQADLAAMSGVRQSALPWQG